MYRQTLASRHMTRILYKKTPNMLTLNMMSYMGFMCIMWCHYFGDVCVLRVKGTFLTIFKNFTPGSIKLIVVLDQKTNTKKIQNIIH